MNNIVKKWQNTSAIINSDSTFIGILKKRNIGILKRDGYHIFNSKEYWLFEEEFIDNQKHTLQQIFDKLSYKNYEKIERFDDVTNEFVVYDGVNSVSMYSKIISLNVIEGIASNKLNICLELLSYGGYNTKSDRVKHLIDIYILILLSNRTKRKQDEIDFVFEIEQDTFSWKTVFGRDNLENGFIELFDWIVTDQEYSEAYKVKLQIVRSLIVKQKHLKDLASLKDKAESIFNRIISGKTDKYFELQKNLKDDFLRISTSIRDYNSSLQTKLFGWLTALSVIIFDFIKSSDGQNLFRRIIFSTSEKTQVLLIVLLIALIVITIMFNLDIKSIRKEYNAVREYYVKQMLVSEKEIEELIKEPRYLNLYNTLLFILFLAIVFRLKFAF